MKKYHWYSSSWSEFEVQSLAFSILRKALYPKYLVRGEFFFPKDNLEAYPLSAKGSKIDIVIFKPWEDKKPPVPILLIEVKKGDKSESTTQGENYSKRIGVPCIYCRGQKDAYNILELVQPYLNKDGASDALPASAKVCLN